MFKFLNDLMSRPKPHDSDLAIINTSLPDLVIDAPRAELARVSEAYMDQLLENPVYGVPAMEDHRGRKYPIPKE